MELATRAKQQTVRRKGMKGSTLSTFPGGSKNRVNRAGEAVRENRAHAGDIAAIEEWRAAHRAVLNTFQAILRSRTRYMAITVAQRHKRRRTIFDKLQREPGMNLVRMDDVAGCRLIFGSMDELDQFRDSLHNARFKHRRRNELDKYDYIKRAKDTGYRGIHDVYVYDVNSETNRHLNGLFVEIQYRTKVQHAWATANEVIGFVTESQPKFQRGDKRYQRAMIYASEILARVFEGCTGPLPELDSKKLVEEFLSLDKKLHLLATLRGLNSSDILDSGEKNAILVFSEADELVIYRFQYAPDALRFLYKLEEEQPDKDIVLVRADTSDDVREAFKNYFSDASDFLYFIEEGCANLNEQART